MNEPYCHSCRADYGMLHAADCCHRVVGERRAAESPKEWIAVPIVLRGPAGHIISKQHIPCRGFVEEGGLCGCRRNPAPSPGAVFYRTDPGIVHLTERAQPPATSALACHACKGPRPPFNRRCQRCGAYPAA